MLWDGIVPDSVLKEGEERRKSLFRTFGDSDSVRVLRFVQELPRSTRHLEIGSSL